MLPLVGGAALVLIAHLQLLGCAGDKRDGQLRPNERTTTAQASCSHCGMRPRSKAHPQPQRLVGDGLAALGAVAAPALGVPAAGGRWLRGGMVAARQRQQRQRRRQPQGAQVHGSQDSQVAPALTRCSRRCLLRAGRPPRPCLRLPTSALPLSVWRQAGALATEAGTAGSLATTREALPPAA